MKKLLISTGLVLGLASSGAFAEHLYVNNVRIDGVDVSSFSFTNGALRLTTTGGTLGVVDGNGGGNDGGGNDGGGNDGGGNDGGGNDGGGNDGGGNDGGGNDGQACAGSPADVVCTAPFAWNGGESRVRQDIPKGKTISTPFVTSGNPAYTGAINFEASTAAPATNIWFSTTPGGAALPGAMCSQNMVSHVYGIKWGQSPSVRHCYLEPNKLYYFNIRHYDSKGGQ